MKEYAVVFAGGQASPGLAEAFKVRYKAEIVFEGERLVDRALRVIRQAGGFTRVFAVLPEGLSLLPDAGEVHLVRAAENLMDNFRAVIAQTEEADLVYLVSCDAPEVSAQVLNDLRRLVHENPGKDVYYPIVKRQAIEERYPGARRTYVRLKEGVFTGGNVIVVNPRRIASCYPQIEEAVGLRKKPMELAARMGTRFLWKALLGQLSLTEITQKIQKITGLQGKVIILPSPEIAMDIDEPEDYRALLREDF